LAASELVACKFNDFYMILFPRSS